MVFVVVLNRIYAKWSPLNWIRKSKQLTSMLKHLLTAQIIFFSISDANANADHIMVTFVGKAKLCGLCPCSTEKEKQLLLVSTMNITPCNCKLWVHSFCLDLIIWFSIYWVLNVVLKIILLIEWFLKLVLFDSAWKLWAFSVAWVMTQTLSLYSLPPTGSAGFENFTTLLDATKGWFYHFFLGNQLTKMTFWGFKISPCFCQDASKEWFYHIFPGKPVDKDDLLGFTMMLLSQKNAVNESVSRASRNI